MSKRLSSEFGDIILKSCFTLLQTQWNVCFFRFLFWIFVSIPLYAGDHTAGEFHGICFSGISLHETCVKLADISWHVLKCSHGVAFLMEFRRVRSEYANKLRASVIGNLNIIPNCQFWHYWIQFSSLGLGFH